MRDFLNGVFEVERPTLNENHIVQDGPWSERKKESARARMRYLSALDHRDDTGRGFVFWLPLLSCCDRGDLEPWVKINPFSPKLVFAGLF